MPHTQEFLYPFGPHTILAVGKHFTHRWGWLTYHSIARYHHGRLRVKTKAMPMALQVEHFGGDDIDLGGFLWLAAVENWADQVLLIDKEQNRLEFTLSTPGTPIDAAQFGTCLVVVCREPKRLRFFDLAVPGIPQIAEWDLSDLGDDFRNITTMHVDQQSGNIFLRSQFHPLVEGNTPAVKVVMPLGSRVGDGITQCSNLAAAAGAPLVPHPRRVRPGGPALPRRQCR